MLDYPTIPGCLVLYKQSAALVSAVDDKIEIQLAGGKVKRVREKDITLLHPGPLNDLAELLQLEAAVEEAWELLQEETTDLRELAELIHGEYTPSSAWSAWCKVAEGLHFIGDPTRISCRSRADIEADIAEREAKAAAEREWNDFLVRLGNKALSELDNQRMKEVERFALAQTEFSRILTALDYPQDPINAHRLLISIGYWPESFNPYPQRLALAQENPQMDCPELPNEERIDLTHLDCYAIDDEESKDPDDAISIANGRIWVHIADVAALVTPDSALDLEARSRAANLYLPETIIHMLPAEVTTRLGLGLSDRSPALSFGFVLSERGIPTDLQIVPSWINVTRKSYVGAEQLMDSQPFVELRRLAAIYRERRLREGAVDLDLPEVNVRVNAEGDIHIRPLQPLVSRQLVTELMLMTGEAVAKYALERGIPIPFITQQGPENPQQPIDTAARFAYRRQMKPSQAKTVESAHAGLGIALYTRTTSPLRRYLDLVVHQQLRAYSNGQTLLTVTEIGERIASFDAVAGRVRRAERMSNLHWKLIYLQQQPKWKGEGIVVEQQDQRVTLVLPDLALETKLRVSARVDLNQRLRLALREVDVPDQSARFRVLG